MRPERENYAAFTFVLVSIAYQCTATTLGTSNRALSLVFDYFPKQELILLSQDMKVAKQHSVQVDDKTDCVFHCTATYWCISVNFRTTPLKNSGRHVCELLSSDQFTSKKKLTQNEDVDHYSVKTPCESKLCQNDGECGIHYDRQDYQCKCKTGFTGKNCESEIIKRIQANTSPVCIGAKDDSYGMFKSPFNGAVKSFQMVHYSGGVAYRIPKTNQYQGKWGDRRSKLFEIHITDTNRNCIAPPANYPMNDTSSLLYSIPGQSYDASSFTFPEFSPRLIVGKDQTFWVWYGEDLANNYESDNSGTTCANVFMEYREM